MGLAEKVAAQVRRPRRRSGWQSVALAACLVLGIALGGTMARTFYGGATPNEAGAEVASLEVFHDFPQGSLGAVVASYQPEEGNGNHAVKRDWLIYLVMFSLALNLGTIGTIVYLRYQDHQKLAAGPAPPAAAPEVVVAGAQAGRVPAPDLAPPVPGAPSEGEGRQAGIDPKAPGAL